MDMCQGSLFKQIFKFSLPLIGTNIMVLLFHAADLVVLGQFAPESIKTVAVASVGATSALNVLLLVFFMGLVPVSTPLQPGMSAQKSIRK